MASKKLAKSTTVTTPELINRLTNRSARVGVAGLGYVGLPLALAFARAGFKVVGFDIDPAKVEALLQRESYIRHIPAADIAEAILKRHMRATDDFGQLGEMDAILICVPTPLDEHREPDLSFVRNTTASIAACLRPGQLVVLESTTFPGTTEEVVLPILQRSGLRCPVAPYEVAGGMVQASQAVEADFLLAFSPEREDPGNK